MRWMWLFVAVVACSGDDSAETLPCDEDVRAEPVDVGFSKSGQSVTIELVAADPSPPDVLLNSWQVELSESETMLEGCDIDVGLYMPDHQHGAGTPVVSPAGEPGRYDITSIGFSMSGLWEVTFDVDCPASGIDSVVFSVCVEG